MSPRGLPDARPHDGPAVLHVDRSFTIHGAGTVVTGTLWSGSLGAGDRVTLLPAGRRARVRSVQVHDAAVERAMRRAARRGEPRRSARRRDRPRRRRRRARTPGLQPAWILDVALELGDADVPRRVQIHHGTRETPARIAEREPGRWQLRCERPLIARAGDRFVVRSISPPGTLGGGVVLDPVGSTHAPAASDPSSRRPPRRRRGPSRARCRRPRSSWNGRCARPPTARRATRSSARARRRRWPSCGPPAAPCGLTGRCTSIARCSTRCATASRPIIAAEGSITLARLRDELGTSRRYAQALLEALDAERVTLRLPDDSRILRRRQKA